MAYFKHRKRRMYMAGNNWRLESTVSPWKMLLTISQLNRPLYLDCFLLNVLEYFILFEKTASRVVALEKSDLGLATACTNTTAKNRELR